MGFVWAPSHCVRVVATWRVVALAEYCAKHRMQNKTMQIYNHWRSGTEFMIRSVLVECSGAWLKLDCTARANDCHFVVKRIDCFHSAGQTSASCASFNSQPSPGAGARLPPRSRRAASRSDSSQTPPCPTGCAHHAPVPTFARTDRRRAASVSSEANERGAMQTYTEARISCGGSCAISV